MDWTRIILDLDRTPFLPNFLIPFISQVIWDLQCSEDGFQALPVWVIVPSNDWGMSSMNILKTVH